MNIRSPLERTASGIASASFSSLVFLFRLGFCEVPSPSLVFSSALMASFSVGFRRFFTMGSVSAKIALSSSLAVPLAVFVFRFREVGGVLNISSSSSSRSTLALLIPCTMFSD